MKKYYDYFHDKLNAEQYVGKIAAYDITKDGKMDCIVIDGTGMNYEIYSISDETVTCVDEAAYRAKQTEMLGKAESEWKSADIQYADITLENLAKLFMNQSDGNESGISVENTNDYILQESNSRNMTTEDLAGLSAEQLRIARNEIAARHGRKFQDEKLQEYFNSKARYIPSVEADDFSESVYNEYELYNQSFIMEQENKMK